MLSLNFGCSGSAVPRRHDTRSSPGP